MFSRSLRSPGVRGAVAAAILVLSTGPSAVGAGAAPKEERAARTTSTEAAAGEASTLAAGGKAAVAADPAAIGSVSAPEFTVSATRAHPGDTVTGEVRVSAGGGTASKVLLRFLPKPANVVVEPTCIPDDKAVGSCALGDVSATGQSVPIKVHVPKTMNSGTIRVKAEAKASGAEAVTATSPAIKVVAAPPTQVAALSTAVKPEATRAAAGTTTKVNVEVKATEGIAGDVRLTLGSTPKAKLLPLCSKDADGRCRMGNVDSSGAAVAVNVSIPASMGRGTLLVKAKSIADNADETPVESAEIAVTPPSQGGGSGGSGGGSGGSGGTGGSTGSGGSGAIGTGGGAGGAYTPPSGLGSPPSGIPPLTGPNANGQPVLPEVAPPAAPGAPGTSPQGRTARLSANGTPTQQLAFDRLAGTQAAWLAALLVAFTLLLTYVRMGKVALARAEQATGEPGKDTGPGGRPKGSGTNGTHRRPRRRMFGGGAKPA